MSEKINYILSNDNRIVAIIQGKSYVVAADHPAYKQIVKAIKDKDSETFLKLVAVDNAISDYTNGEVTIKNGQVTYKGKEIKTSLSARLLKLMANGFPFEPWVLFLQNLMQNPSGRAVKELYDFLEHHDLPLTEDGHFLAYKRVRDDFTDVHTGKVKNDVGLTVEMDRNEVDDDWGIACSQGYHVGSMSYVRNFGSGPIVIVKINPKDVVTVPESETNKCRVCRYEVLDIYTGDLNNALYSAVGAPMPKETFEDDDQHEDEDDDYEDETTDDEVEDEDDDEDDDFND